MMINIVKYVNKILSRNILYAIHLLCKHNTLSILNQLHFSRQHAVVVLIDLPLYHIT